VADVARLALVRVGYVVETRTSPQKAWRAFAAAPGRFDVVIIDRQMPEMPGTELIRIMRTVAPTTPVILMSGQFEPIDEDELGRLGGVTLLAKPFDIEAIARSVDAVLRRRDGSAGVVA
jgi:DNA-binding response OmpR family regulator